MKRYLWQGVELEVADAASQMQRGPIRLLRGDAPGVVLCCQR